MIDPLTKEVKRLWPVSNDISSSKPPPCHSMGLNHQPEPLMNHRLNEEISWNPHNPQLITGMMRFTCFFYGLETWRHVFLWEKTMPDLQIINCWTLAHPQEFHVLKSLGALKARNGTHETDPVIVDRMWNPWQVGRLELNEPIGYQI